MLTSRDGDDRVVNRAAGHFSGGKFVDEALLGRLVQCGPTGESRSQEVARVGRT